MKFRSKTSQIVLAVFLCLCIQNQISAADKLTKPNEPGPWPSIQINTYTGNLFYERSDLFITTRGEIPLEISFSYNSLKHLKDYGYGNGWSFSFGMYYSYIEDDFTVYREEGKEDVFTWDGSGFVPPVGVYDALTEYESGKYILRTKYGIKYYFENDSHYQLTKIEDRNGNATILSYSGGKPTTITDPSGRVLNLSWVNNHLVQITDPNTSPSRVIAFTYDDSWNLIQVTRPLNNTFYYGYDPSGNMTSVTDPNSNTVNISYDVNEAVAGISCIPANYTKTFAYNNCNNTTTVSQVVSTVNRQTIYTFDLSGKVTGIQYPGGGSVSYNWDSQNNLNVFTNETGSTTTYTYDLKGNMLSVTDCRLNSEIYTYESTYNDVTSYRDKNNNLTTYSYDANGNLIIMTDCFNKSVIYTYDSFGNMITSKDKNNFTTIYTYDIYGNQTGLTDPLSFSETRTYDLVGNMLTFTDKRSFTTTYSNDLLDRNTLITDAMGYTRVFVFDANGNLVVETNQNGKTTTYVHDMLNRLVLTIDANGGTFTMVYDEAGNVISETNARGYATTYTYNSRDWVTSVKDCLNNTETFTYNAAGFMLSSTDKGGNTTNYTRNCLGQVTLQTDPNGYTDSFVYDPAGNQTSHTNKNGIPTTYIFDGLGRLTTINYPMSFSEAFTYDAEDNQTGFTDRNGNTTTTVYDALGRALSVTDPTSKTESRTYDGEGNVASSTDKNGKTTTYAYDPLGRLILKTDPAPLSYTESLTWDGIGNLLTSTDRRGKTTTRQYDNLDRLTILTTPMGYTETTSYDAMGNVTSFTNKNGFATTFTYDCLDQLVNTTDPLNFTETNAYNANGHRTGYTDKNGNTTTWNYSCCRLLSETDPLNFTEYYGYDNNGNRITLTNRNGGITTSFYDQLDRLFKTSTPMGNLTQYVLDGVGNVTAKTDANLNTISFTYNTRNELISAVYPDATSVTFTYNNNGDLLQTVNTGGIAETITFAYDVLGRDTSKVTNYGAFTKTISYTLDQNGNILTLTSETGTITYVYDDDNRVTQVTDQNAGVTTFQYDEMGNPVRVDYPNGVSTLTSYDANGNVISVITQTTPPPPPPGNPERTPGIAKNESAREILYDTDYSVVEFLSPVSGTGLGENELVTITVMNFGNIVLPNFIVTYTLGETFVTEFVEVEIPTWGYYIHTFAQTVDLSDPGDYEITACVIAAGDEFPDNDCLTTIISNFIVVTCYQAFTYGYNANGNKTSELRNDGTNIILEYSDRNEPISENNMLTGDLNLIAYKPGGQRLTFSRNGIDEYYYYDLDNFLLSAGDNTFTRDDNGNRITTTTASGDVTTNTFDFDNQLNEVVFPDLSLAHYYYSALGDQLKKNETGITTYSLYSGRTVINEFNASGNPTYYYNPEISITGGSLIGYYYYNGSGSTTLQLNQNQVVVAIESYDFFGNSTFSTGAWMNNKEEFHYMAFAPALGFYFDDEKTFPGYSVYDPNTSITLNPDPFGWHNFRSSPFSEEIGDIKKKKEWEEGVCPEGKGYDADIPIVRDTNDNKSDREREIEKKYLAAVQKACEDKGKEECKGECDYGSLDALCPPICFGNVSDYPKLNAKTKHHENPHAWTDPATAKCICQCLKQEEIDKIRNAYAGKKK
jgi:YD repeat-containing protein